jgi:hypothetical protein
MENGENNTKRNLAIYSLPLVVTNCYTIYKTSMFSRSVHVMRVRKRRDADRIMGREITWKVTIWNIKIEM